MTMDSEAIKRIETLTAAAHATPETDCEPVAVMPENARLVSLDKYQEQPSRFKGKLGTHSIEDFARYIEHMQNAGTSPQCFIDDRQMQATAYFDLGDPSDPGHGDNTAVLTLQRTPAYTSLVKHEDAPASQRELINWLQDWTDCIQGSDSDEGFLDPQQTVRAMARIQLSHARDATHTDEGLRASRSAMEKAEAKSSGGALPQIIHFKCAPYEGLPEMSFELRLAVIDRGDELGLKFRVMAHQAAIEQMGNNFLERLNERLGDSATLFKGVFVQ